jgi:hypothetical protein
MSLLDSINHHHRQENADGQFSIRSTISTCGEYYGTGIRLRSPSPGEAREVPQYCVIGGMALDKTREEKKITSTVENKEDRQVRDDVMC